MTINKITNCCDNPRLMVNESFSYEVTENDGKLFINLNDYATDGFEGLECMTCYKEYNVKELADSGKVEW